MRIAISNLWPARKMAIRTPLRSYFAAIITSEQMMSDFTPVPWPLVIESIMRPEHG